MKLVLANELRGITDACLEILERDPAISPHSRKTAQIFMREQVKHGLNSITWAMKAIGLGLYYYYLTLLLVSSNKEVPIHHADQFRATHNCGPNLEHRNNRREVEQESESVQESDITDANNKTRYKR